MRISVSFMCLFFLLVSSVPAFSTNEDNPEENSFGSLHKSLLIPGWGQLAEKKYVKGITFVTAEIFCLYSIFSNNHKGNLNYRLYQDAGNVEDAVFSRDLTEKYDRRRNVFILAALGVWALNLVDIYFTVRQKEKEDKSVSIQLELANGWSRGLTLSIRF